MNILYKTGLQIPEMYDVHHHLIKLLDQVYLGVRCHPKREFMGVLFFSS